MTKRFVDKVHAESMVWLLEAHFRRISRRLDAIGIPNDEVDPLTIEQRVGILIDAFERTAKGHNAAEALRTAAQTPPRDTSEWESASPEDLDYALSQDVKWPATREEVLAVVALLEGAIS